MKYLHKLSARWCQPCKALSGVIEDINLESLNIKLVEHDIDIMDHAELQRLGVRGVPTLILIDESGTEIARKTGAMSATQLENWLGKGA